MSTAEGMFARCSKMKSFYGSLRYCTHCRGMFNNCTSLSTFDGDLRWCRDARAMFTNCKLNKSSLECIADTIKSFAGTDDAPWQHTDGYHIHIGYNATASDAKAVENKLKEKGWTAKMVYTG